MAEARALSVREVAERLDVSETTVRRLIRTGELPSLRVGAKILRVLDVDVDAYVRRRRDGEGPE